MLSLVTVHILHLILETDLYLYFHNDCILQDFKVFLNISTEDLKAIERATSIMVHHEFIVDRNLKVASFRLV
jgi:hypothetical protein